MVRNLILIRHAQAETQVNPSADFQRKLTQHGTHQAELLGSALAGLNLSWDAVYVSPAIRTQLTTERAFGTLDPIPRLITSEELYEATSNLMKAFVTRINPIFHHVALVGHNPGISDLFHYLSDDLCSYEPATAAWLQFEGEWKHLAQSTCLVKNILTF